MFYRGVSSGGDNNTWDTLSWRGGDLALQALRAGATCPPLATTPMRKYRKQAAAGSTQGATLPLHHHHRRPATATYASSPPPSSITSTFLRPRTLVCIAVARRPIRPAEHAPRTDVPAVAQVCAWRHRPRSLAIAVIAPLTTGMSQAPDITTLRRRCPTSPPWLSFSPQC